MLHRQNQAFSAGFLPVRQASQTLSRLSAFHKRFDLAALKCQHNLAGFILHGRYGLALPYLSPEFLDRVALAVGEAGKLGLQTWLYDEMNWPSGTADQRVLRARPDLSQRYLECIHFPLHGPGSLTSPARTAAIWTSSVPRRSPLSPSVRRGDSRPDP